MAPPQSLFHALLRPSILQILRATGYQAAKPSTIDLLTDLTARYFYALCQNTARSAMHNSVDGDLVPTICDVRVALQQVGALLPETNETQQRFMGVEDMRGVNMFTEWAHSQANREIKRIALDGNEEAKDYLDALKKKHSKSDDDAKYMGTLLGRPHEHGDVMVEGGEVSSIFTWEDRLKEAAVRPPQVVNAEPEREDSETPSSGLSSLGDRDIADDMDLS